MRTAKRERNTAETKINAVLNLDGTGQTQIKTGIGFFDHMLGLMGRHGFFDLELIANGDLDVDCHHTVEDAGIVLGQAFRDALGDRHGIARYGQSAVPMDETLVLCAIDISGRPYAAVDNCFACPSIGALDTEMIPEFFRAFCDHAGVNLHIKVLAGQNGHHIVEAMFKAFGRALDMATVIDPRITGVLSTKGMLEN